MTNSLLALNCLFNSSSATRLTALAAAIKQKSFIKPDNIMKSSVGEFYEQNMTSFLTLSKDIYDYVYATAPGKIGSDMVSIDRILTFAFQCVPLGCLVDSTEVEQSCFEYKHANDFFTYMTHPLPEVQKITAKYLSARDLFLNKSQVQAYDSAVKELSTIAQSICAGYTPNTEVPLTMYVPADSGCLQENVLAAAIYPWVMQPIRQLRMLIPALEPTMVSRIRDVSLHPNVILPSTAFGVGPCFDMVTDYMTYVSFLICSARIPGLRIQRQVWTPFLGIANSTDIPKHVNQDLYQRIMQAYLSSRRLYIEMLKTGLQYEAQYAVIGGMAGRFMLEAPIGSLVSLVHTYGTVSDDITTSAGKAIVSSISDMLYKAGLLEKPVKLGLEGTI